MKRSVLIPERVRKIQGSFAFIEHRFLQKGFFENLTHHELILYLFFVMAGGKEGISWYSYDRIIAYTNLYLDDYIVARNALIDKDLLAFDGHVFQVLSLPDKLPVFEKRLLKTYEDMKNHDPATLGSKLAEEMGVRL